MNPYKFGCCTYVLLFMILISCTMGCADSTNCCTIIDTDVSIKYLNQSGEDLFLNGVEYDESKIKIYYKNNDNFDYIYKSNLDHPNMHFLVKDSLDQSTLVVFPSDIYEGNFSTTLIELNENVTDTLLCEFELDTNRSICTRVWLNGEEMESRHFQIIK